jgi:hypothetical protein
MRVCQRQRLGGIVYAVQPWFTSCMTSIHATIVHMPPNAWEYGTPKGQRQASLIFASSVIITHSPQLGEYYNNTIVVLVLILILIIIIILI